MAKIRRNKDPTSKTLPIEGRDAKRALTTSLIPSFRDIILSGRRARNALKALIADNYYISNPDIAKTKSIRDARTTKASSIFHGELRYGSIGPIRLNINPFAMILIMASIKNIMVKN
jgi:hypothetical protein